VNVAGLRHRIEGHRVAFIHDESGSVYDWKLRSLPALQFLGIAEFTYPTSWRQLKRASEYDKGGKQFSFPGYEYHVLGGIDLAASTALGVITTSYYENETQYTIRPLIDRYTKSGGPLVVVADEKRFQPDGGARPLFHEPFVTHLGSYDQVYSAIEEAYADAGWPLPLRDTKNCFLQDMANVYEFIEGTRIETTTALFDVLADAPYLPLYLVFGTIFDQPDSFGTGPLETDKMVEALGGWLRRRIEWDRSKSIEVATQLNRDVAADPTTFDPSYARRSATVADAASAAESLDYDSNTVDEQYYNWLTQHTS
jgi:hypothetical protein